MLNVNRTPLFFYFGEISLVLKESRLQTED